MIVRPILKLRAQKRLVALIAVLAWVILAVFLLGLYGKEEVEAPRGVLGAVYLKEDGAGNFIAVFTPQMEITAVVSKSEVEFLLLPDEKFKIRFRMSVPENKPVGQILPSGEVIPLDGILMYARVDGTLPRSFEYHTRAHPDTIADAPISDLQKIALGLRNNSSWPCKKYLLRGRPETALVGGEEHLVVFSDDIKITHFECVD